jgi:hypothetical protein
MRELMAEHAQQLLLQDHNKSNPDIYGSESNFKASKVKIVNRV